MNQANLKKILDWYIKKLAITNDENHNEIFKWKACLQFEKLDFDKEDFMLNFEGSNK